MSLPANLPAAILDTVLSGLAALFLAGADGDAAASREAASHILNAYHPQTEDELRLAASIIGFSFQALETLAQAAAPDLPVTRGMRLRGSAVSLSREAGRAERRLGQLRKAREQASAAPTAEIQPVAERHTEQAAPQIPAAPTTAALSPPTPATAALSPPTPAKGTGTVAQAAQASGTTWTKAYEERQREARIAASIKRAEARFGTHAPATVSSQPSIAAAS